MKMNKKYLKLFNYINESPKLILSLFLFIWISVSLAYWKKYEWNPTSMVNFGLEFALQNLEETPESAILFKGEEGDLGAGYDGQIFYYYSRSLSNFSFIWPKGFDESIRAPRIGYPLLVSFFGLFGKGFSVFGMYFLNFVLFYLSYLCLRSLLASANRIYSLIYLFNPFSLASYYVLVSDSIMVSLIIIAYYQFCKGYHFRFLIFASLAILTKEPALFFLFPLGLKSLWERDFKRILIVSSTLIIPVLWHAYLSYKFPNWRANRLMDFILPFEGILRYLDSLFTMAETSHGVSDWARALSRFPLVCLFLLGVFIPFTGNIRKGWEFRIGFSFTMVVIATAGFYHYWSVYENVARMFTLSIPCLILLKNEDKTVITSYYFTLTLLLLVLFFVKVFIISKNMAFQVGYF